MHTDEKTSALKAVVSIEIPGKPQGKARPRFARVGKGVRTYNTEETESYEGLVKMISNQAMQGKSMFLGQVSMKIFAFYPMPKMSKSKEIMAESGQIRPVVKPDWDNVGKLISDAMNGIVYKDDKQIVEASVSKRYSHKPGVLVIVQEII